jgi:hypothetical protein
MGRVSAGLNDKEVGSGDSNHVRVTGVPVLVFSLIFSELSEICTYSLFARPSTADITNAFTTFKAIYCHYKLPFTVFTQVRARVCGSFFFF